MNDNKSKGISFFWIPACIALVVALLDQGTKILIDSCCEIGWHKCIISGFFNLVHVRNTGCAWSMLSNHTYVLGIFSLVAFIAIVVKFRSFNSGSWPMAICMSMLAGGILGNMVDRLFRASVIDFLDFNLCGYHWPAFNVADSAITVSVIALCILSLFGNKKQANTEK